MLENSFKKNIKFKFNLIDKKIKDLRKKKNSKGSLDKEYLDGKKNFSSPPFQYFSVNFLNSSEISDFNLSGKLNETKFLLKLQNKDGSYDEWYKNERSYCTTSYTSFLFSNLLLNIKNIDLNLKKDLINSLEKSFFFLKNKFNKNILNQNLAKLAFLQNFNEIQKKSLIIKEDLNFFLDKVHKFITNSNELEYKGLDLGYLTISLMLSAEILKRKNTKKRLDIFLIILNLCKNLTSDFNYFPSYIFSRSSRIFLISGFYFAFRQNLISNNEFKKILNFYNKNFTTFYALNDLRYLSFFYSTDHALILSSELKKIIKNDKIKKPNNIITDYFILKKNKKKVFIYKKNPNLVAFNRNNNIKIFLCDSAISSGKRFVPRVLKNFSVNDKYVFLKQNFTKVSNLKKIAFRFLALISILAKFKPVNKLIDIYSKYSLITKSYEIKNIRKYRRIYLKKKKIIFKDIVISSGNIYSMAPSLEAHYFSPTSYLNRNEIMKMKKISVKKFDKMNKKIILTIYEHK